MRAKFRAISCGELLGVSQRSQVEKVPETVVAGNVPDHTKGGRRFRGLRRSGSSPVSRR